MQAEQFKLLNAARTLEDFTIRDLADRAGVNPETAKTVIRRRNDIFVATGDKRRSASGGKASNVYRVLPDARPALLALVDSTRAEAIPESIDKAEAEAAFRNDHNRWRVRRHLAEARDLEPCESRNRHIQKAAKWIRQEKWRIQRFCVGIAVPDVLSDEIATLQLQVDAAEIMADRLDHNPELGRIDQAARWIVHGFDLSFEHEGRPNVPVFAPLGIEASSPEELVGQLEIAIRGSGVACSVPTERLILALLAALPWMGDARWEGRTAFQTACDLINRLGPETVGTALADQLHGHDARSTLWVRHTVRDILIAFTMMPSLLDERRGSAKIALWFSKLMGTALFHESHKKPLVAAARYFDDWPLQNTVNMLNAYTPTLLAEDIEEEDGEDIETLPRMPAIVAALRYATNALDRFRAGSEAHPAFGG